LMLRTILDRVLDEAQKAGRLGMGTDLAYRIELPELTPGQNQADATAAQILMQVITTAQDRGWMSNDTAMRLLSEILDSHVDLKDEHKRIEDEDKEPPNPKIGDRAAQAIGVVTGSPLRPGQTPPSVK